jgi:two-component system NarL family sensor kinase
MATDQVADSRDGDTLLPGERHVLEIISAGAPLADALDALCRFIDARSGLHSSVFLLDANGAHLRLAAGPSLPEVWRQAVSVFPVTATACGAAVTRREQIISPDILTDPLYRGFRDAARAVGFHACWSTPILSDRRALGTFAVYSAHPGRPSDANLQLVGRATYLARIAIERHQAEAGLRESERLLRLVLDALPVGVGVVDASGNLILSNPAAHRIWNGVIPSGSERYTASKAWWHATGQRLSPDEWPSVRAFASGENSVDEVIEIESFDGARKILQSSAVPIRDAEGRITGALVVNEDISGRKTSERALNDSYNQLRTLTGTLMRAQDDERRRIARMLHETAAQDLAALKMLLARLNRTADRLDDDDRNALIEGMALADQSMTQIRTLSYLLHPPFLDEAGLLSAVRWYASGFGKRSGITVELDLPAHFERLPRDTETALFRVVQESLINIHRHAGSPTAHIRLRREAEALLLEIEDSGGGIPSDVLERVLSRGGGVGVGIAGMWERVEQLGGRLEVTSSDQGTTGTVVRVRLPLAKDAR